MLVRIPLLRHFGDVSLQNNNIFIHKLFSGMCMSVFISRNPWTYFWFPFFSKYVLTTIEGHFLAVLCQQLPIFHSRIWHSLSQKLFRNVRPKVVVDELMHHAKNALCMRIAIYPWKQRQPDESREHNISISQQQSTEIGANSNQTHLVTNVGH